MFEKYFMAAFHRQKEQLPAVLTALDLIQQRELTRTRVIQLAQDASHTLRNALTVVVVVLELHELEGNSTQTLTEGADGTFSP